jgi:AraC-like DNA-binding protein
MGMDSAEVWAAFGFSPEQLADPDTRIPIAVGQQLIEWVVAGTGISDYGLRAAEVAEPGLFDLPEYAARCQPTLRGAVERIISLVPLISDAGSIRLEERDGLGTIEVTSAPNVDLDPASVEFNIAYFIIAGRRFTGIDYRPQRVLLRHPAPSDTSHHERLFGIPVEFGAERNAIVVTSEQLDLPLKLADSRLAILLDQATEHLLAKVGPRGTFAADVRRLVTKHLPSDGAPVTTIARELGITPRTLHRRLAEESTTFRDLADDVRKGLALAYMDRRELAVSEIAYLLGFSGVQAFHRAFKRWANTTPGEFRRRR